jgi:hypothetical protein
VGIVVGSLLVDLIGPHAAWMIVIILAAVLANISRPVSPGGSRRDGVPGPGRAAAGNGAADPLGQLFRDLGRDAAGRAAAQRHVGETDGVQCRRPGRAGHRAPGDFHDRNETLYFTVLSAHPAELLRIVADPLAGGGIGQSAAEYCSPDGIYLPMDRPGDIENSAPAG